MNPGARASLVTSLPGGTLIPLPNSMAEIATDPLTIAPGITATSTNPDDSLIGAVSYSFVNNGTWDGTAALIAVQTDVFGSDAYGVKLFFAKPVAGVGGFFNYAYPLLGFDNVKIKAFDIGGNELESFDISDKAPIDTPFAVNGGAFFGFLRSTPDIAAFSLENSGVAMKDLTIVEAAATVPEPGTVFLVVLTLLLSGVWRVYRA